MDLIIRIIVPGKNPKIILQPDKMSYITWVKQNETNILFANQNKSDETTKHYIELFRFGACVYI